MDGKDFRKNPVGYPPFWLVWNPLRHAPNYQHISSKVAEEEARRLAMENPGQSFYVLCPTAQIRRADIFIERYEQDLEILF